MTGDIADTLTALGWACEQLHNHRRFTRTINAADYVIDTNIDQYANEFAHIAASMFELGTFVDVLNPDVWAALAALHDGGFFRAAHAAARSRAGTDGTGEGTDA